MSASCLLRIIILEETLQSYDSHYNYLSIRLSHRLINAHLQVELLQSSRDHHKDKRLIRSLVLIRNP